MAACERIIWACGCVVALLLVSLSSCNAGRNYQREEIQKDAVAAGVAEFYQDEDGRTQWRWKPPSPSTEGAEA